jgi:hypothetical protein
MWLAPLSPTANATGSGDNAALPAGVRSMNGTYFFDQQPIPKNARMVLYLGWRARGCAFKGSVHLRLGYDLNYGPGEACKHLPPE